MVDSQQQHWGLDDLREQLDADAETNEEGVEVGSEERMGEEVHGSGGYSEVVDDCSDLVATENGVVLDDGRQRARAKIEAILLLLREKFEAFGQCTAECKAIMGGRERTRRPGTCRRPVVSPAACG